jgi:single-strand DNA-binding protein
MNLNFFRGFWENKTYILSGGRNPLVSNTNKEAKIMNQVQLIGRIARDVELTEISNNRQVINNALAINRKSKDGIDYVDFIPITAWNGTAKLIHTYMHKGDELAIVGQLRMRQFETKQGQHVSTVEVLVSEVQFLRKKIATDQARTQEQQILDNIESLIVE